MRSRKIIFTFISIFLLFGCSDDSREIDDRSMIVGMGIDQNEDGKLSISIQVPLLGGEEGTSPQAREFETFTAEGDSFWEAIAQLEAMTPSVLFFGKLQVVTVGDTLAKEGIGRLLDVLGRIPSIANQIYLLVVEEGDAKEFIKQESPLVTLPALYLNEFFKADQKIARTTDVKLFEYIRDSNMISNASTLPLATTNQKTITVENMAVFKNNKLVGKLIENEVGMSQLLKKGSISSMNLNIDLEHDGKPLTVSLVRVELNIDINYEKTDPVSFHFDISGHGQVAEISNTNIRVNYDLVKKINERAREEIKNNLLLTTKKMQSINVEPWFLGQRIWALDNAFFKTINWEETGWKNSDIDVTVDFHVETTGQKAMLEKKKVDR